jgi:hypothetical protein
MTIEWFDKEPGEAPIADCGDGSAMMILGGVEVGDYVRLSGDLGGQSVRILRIFNAPCPVSTVICKHYELEGGINVAESDQFYWYKRN